MQCAKRILIYGYGNTGRQDDALGVLVAEDTQKFLHKSPFQGVDVEVNFQLNIEDAATISNYDLVIFVDASQENIEDLLFIPVEPSDKVEFSMHAVSPGFVVKLCEDIYSRVPQSYILHVKGYKFGFLKKMTRKAENNLEKANTFLQQKIQEFCYSSINN